MEEIRNAIRRGLENDYVNYPKMLEQKVDVIMTLVSPLVKGTTSCPHCGTTELLCGYNGQQGCQSESNKVNS